MSRSLLLVDDDALLRRSLGFNLERAGYKVHTVATAEDALSWLQINQPDLVLLDITLPEMDGLEAMRILRREFPSLPVILLTARRRELDEILGLELGADDYVTKPFDVDVLIAHIKAVLRRAEGAPQSISLSPIVLGDLTLDPQTRQATLGKTPLSLSPREFDVLYLLASHSPNVVSTEDLLTQVWGSEFEGQPQVVYVHIRWLREKIEADPNNPKRILTVRGIGYRYVPLENGK
ncbi:MAG: response regulator transcription factor [Thermanaerothrix sp.]|nr:response regulator transcription factor [Thermanaerothrix sp.]